MSLQRFILPSRLILKECFKAVSRKIMMVCIDITHHNENVISAKTTTKITSLAKHIPATTFSWLNKK